jgi:hypothetical protein
MSPNYEVVPLTAGDSVILGWTRAARVTVSSKICEAPVVSPIELSLAIGSRPTIHNLRMHERKHRRLP